MKKTLLPYALLSLMLTAGISCTKNPGGPSSEGVRFSFVLSGDATRTAYSGDGTFDTGGNLTQERIDWVNNDLVTIYSPEAMKRDWSHVSDYRVVTVSTHDAAYVHHEEHDLMSHAEVEATDGVGLTWEVGLNHFYGMYPSASTAGFSAAEKAWIGLDGTVLKGTIPSVQTPSWDLSGTTAIVGTPDMKYAWMYATGSGTKGDSDVHLPFFPKFTAFEFTIGSGENSIVHLSSFTLETTSASAAAVLAGNFSLSNGNTSSQAVSVSSGTGSKSVTVSFPTGTAVTRETATAAAKTLTFTVFALPMDITSLKITFTGDEIGTRTLALNDGNGDPLNFTGCKKYRIRGLSFPSLLTAQGEDILWDLEAHGEALNWY